MRSVHQRFVISAGVVLALGFAFVLGLYVNEIARPSNHQIPLLNADSAASNERFAMASGRIDDRVEGIYTLDFLTGELQLAVLSTKTAKFNNVFRANVIEDLGAGQNPKYLMVTGAIFLPRGAQPARAADSAVYVMDTNTGKFAVYAAPWRPEMASAGRQQGGDLVRIDMGQARNALIRD